MKLYRVALTLCLGAILLLCAALMQSRREVKNLWKAVVTPPPAEEKKRDADPSQ